MRDNREFGVVTFNGVRFPAADYIAYSNTGTFEGKVVDGDYTRDSDKLMSAKIWTAFAGGIGQDRHREGSDEGRLWFHTLNLDHQFSASLATKVDSYDEAKYPLGDLGGFMYAADDSLEIWKFTESTGAWTDTTDALDDAPTKAGLEWNGDLYIPHGANGYSHYDGSTLTPEAGENVIDFVDWDDRLFCITTGGTLKYSTNGTTWATAGQINTSVTPKRLVVYLDSSQNEVIYVTTNRGLYAYNPTTLKFVRTQVRIPNHPDNGLGADVWRPGEDLFFSAGLQVYRYTGGSAVPMGPDRGDGLPDELRGRIVDLCSEHNSICALVEGIAIAGVVTEEAEFDPGLDSDEPLEISETSTKSALLAWTGTGWHPRWLSSDDSGTPHWMYLSAGGDAYRLWWGYGESIYSLPLSRTFSNSSQLLRTGEGQFERTGYMDLGWVDHNMREFDKLASHVEINMENTTPLEGVTVEYKTDFDTSWTNLGVAFAYDPDGDSAVTAFLGIAPTAARMQKFILPFGVRVSDAGEAFSYGLKYRRIRPRLTFERDPDDITQTPILDSIVLKYIRLPITGEYFTVTIPLDFSGEWEGRSAAQIKVEIDDLLANDEFILMNHGYDEDQLNHRVRLTKVGGNDRTGPNSIGGRGVTVIAIPLEGYNGNTIV